MQRNWIGRSQGTEIDFKIDGYDQVIQVFTTRPDTIYGASFMVVAPEYPIVRDITIAEHLEHVNNYLREAQTKSDIERQETTHQKTGAFTGAYAINPVTDQKIPIWVADYVLSSYGTGAIMAVPAHDQRDFEFAQKFELPIPKVITADSVGPETEPVYEGEGTMVNSGPYNGLAAAKPAKNGRRSGS